MPVKKPKTPQQVVSELKNRAYDQRLTLTVEEAAAKLGISRGMAYELARKGSIPTLKLGRRLLVVKAAFEKLFEGGVA